MYAILVRVACGPQQQHSACRSGCVSHGRTAFEEPREGTRRPIDLFVLHPGLSVRPAAANILKQQLARLPRHGDLLVPSLVE